MNPVFKATIAICTYNRVGLLKLCVNSISQLDYRGKDQLAIGFEVLIVDNNSTDDTAAYCKSLPGLFPEINFKYILETNQGIAFARTRSAMEAKGEIVAFIDDDCLADSNWLKEIVSFYDKNHDAMSTGGKIVPKYLTPVADWFGKYFWGLVANYDLGPEVFQMKRSRYPSGANMHFRKIVFEKYGYFDGNLGRSGNSLMAGEEKAMYLKLLRGNEKVFYLPHIIVHHHVEGNKFDKAYVKKHSMGIGGSERLMNKGSFFNLVLKFIEYKLKLGYAIAYGFLYLAKGQPQKMWMLIKFRWWVILGFMFPSKAKG